MTADSRRSDLSAKSKHYNNVQCKRFPVNTQYSSIIRGIKSLVKRMIPARFVCLTWIYLFARALRQHPLWRKFYIFCVLCNLMHN